MTELIESTLRVLNGQLPGRVSRPGDEQYAAATAIWAKPVGRMPRTVVHCRTLQDIQLAIAAARSAGLSLSVRGGGHDWAGRALCDGLVIDLSAMRDVAVSHDRRSARIAGGARASDVLAATDPLGLAAVTGSCSSVGMAGLTLGGGYGPLIGRFGLALDNLIAADVVLGDGRVVTAERGRDEDLLWALRGGGGNFGVVTAMRIRLHEVPNVISGMLVYPFSEAKTVLRCYADAALSMPDQLTVQVGAVAGPDGMPVILLVPTWCGPPGEGDANVAPLLELGRLLDNTLDAVRYGTSLSVFDPHIVNGRRTFVETCSLPALDGAGVDVLVEAMAKAVSAGCAIFTHEFRGAASRVPVEATAFGLRRDHILIEILASFPDRSDRLEERRHQQWVRDTWHAFDTIALPGGSEFARPRRGGSCGGQLWAQRRTVDQGQTTVRPRQRLPFRHSAADPSARNSSRVNSKTGERRASVHHLPTEASNGRPKMAISKTAEVRAVCDPDNGEWLQVTPGERFKIRIASSQTMGSYAVIEIVADPHNGVPLHIHSKEEEHFIVLEGTLDIAVGDRRWDAPAGTSVTVKRGVPHAWCNPSETPLHMLVVFSPGQIDGLFKAVAGVDDVDKITAIAARYGTQLIGPPLQETVRSIYSPRK